MSPPITPEESVRVIGKIRDCIRDSNSSACKWLRQNGYTTKTTTDENRMFGTLVTYTTYDSVGNTVDVYQTKPLPPPLPSKPVPPPNTPAPPPPIPPPGPTIPTVKPDPPKEQPKTKAATNPVQDANERLQGKIRDCAKDPNSSACKWLRQHGYTNTGGKLPPPREEPAFKPGETLEQAEERLGPKKPKSETNWVPIAVVVVAGIGIVYMYNRQRY